VTLKLRRRGLRNLPALRYRDLYQLDSHLTQGGLWIAEIAGIRCCLNQALSPRKKDKKEKIDTADMRSRCETCDAKTYEVA
jgi:hypothetical protein